MANGQRIILTREEHRNRSWAERLHRAGLAYVELPLVRYAALPAPASRDFSDFDWILFTSPQGVRAFADLRPEIGDARCGVLGHGTAAVLRQAGWRDDLNAGAADGVAFAGRFLAVAGEPGRVLLPGPTRRLAEPRASLTAAGYIVQELPLYETLAVAPASIVAAEMQPDDVLFFCSPSAVRAFADARDDRPPCVAIGQTTAAACRAAGFAPAVAANPDLDAMVRAAGIAGLPGPSPEPVNPELES